MKLISLKLMSLLMSAGVVAASGMAIAADSPPPALKVVARVPGPDGGWDYATFGTP